MPLRPPLVAFHPKGPRPPQRRKVYCPACRHGFELSRRAVTVRCPKCTAPLAFDDLQLSQRVEGAVTTMGHVVLGASSSVAARLTCGMLSSAGRFEGKATVYGTVTLEPGSRTSGELTARSLTVQRGATCDATVRITPDPGPPPAPQKRTLAQISADTPRPLHGLPRVVPRR